MEKTIKLMKYNGLFDILVDNILHKHMNKEDVAVALDSICEADENFENTFFNDFHELGLNVIWKELCAKAEDVHRTEAQK